MNQANSSRVSLPPFRCSQCWAVVKTDATRCWLCDADLSSAGAISNAGSNAIWPTAQQGGNFSLASLMMFVTLVSVLCGVWTIYPGLSILLGLILLIVWARTAVVLRQRAVDGKPITFLDKLHIFLSTFAFTAIAFVITGFTAVAALATACGVLISTMDSEAVPFTIGAATFVGVGCFLLFLLFRSRMSS